MVTLKRLICGLNLDTLSKICIRHSLLEPRVMQFLGLFYYIFVFVSLFAFGPHCIQTISRAAPYAFGIPFPKKIISQSYKHLAQKTHLDSGKYHPVSHVMSRKSSNSFNRSMTNPRTGSKNFKNKQFVIHHSSLWQLAHQIDNETTINYSANATSQSSLPNCRQPQAKVGANRDCLLIAARHKS